MKCSRIREWISREMDGQLDPQHVPTLEEHLQSCDECREYRDDLALGSRFLQATTPVLPDDFEWRLQLRLSRSLREAAATAHPWRDDGVGWRGWLQRALPSAAVGLAAVLAVAVLMPPPPSGDAAAPLAASDPTLRLPTQTAGVPASLSATRRPLTAGRPTSFGGGLQQPVSGRGGGLAAFALPSADEAALLRIRELEQDNQTLRRRLFAKDRQIQYLQAQLDSLSKDAVDTR